MMGKEEERDQAGVEKREERGLPFQSRMERKSRDDAFAFLSFFPERVCC